jgi:ABC-type multidrug transport system fused ATPase/permease subunit
MIAHRLSTVRHCDRIHLLEKGRLAAQARMTSWSLATRSQRMTEANAPS